jgi:hypothetical protein
MIRNKHVSCIIAIAIITSQFNCTNYFSQENLKFKVESMGGTHMTALTNAVTHLVACRVLGARTAKYNVSFYIYY